MNTADRDLEPRSLIERVFKAGICTGCGACVAATDDAQARMCYTDQGPIPEFEKDARLPQWVRDICPGAGINYPQLYQAHYGRLPDNWLTGIAEQVYTGYSADPKIRRAGASGGVLTHTLMHLLASGRVDGVILARQGVPTPEQARAVIATTPEEIMQGSQSIYIPVAMLDILRDLVPGQRYAITALPEQSAALRVLQQRGFAPANQVKYVLGPYTGTALYPAAIRGFLRAKGISRDDPIVDLKWRAGEWPGYLQIKLQSGRVVKTPKVYYNYLIPFFVTQTSLQSMDFANEFADLAVGDAWSPALEADGQGHSVIVTRTVEMQQIIEEMEATSQLVLNKEDPAKAADMHGHMLDFKKRGGWLRNQWRRKTGRLAPDYGYRPARVPLSRVAVEVVISSLFAVGRTRLARWLIAVIPESISGPFFNMLRVSWKRISRPTKRKGLAEYRVEITG